MRLRLGRVSLCLALLTLSLVSLNLPACGGCGEDTAGSNGTSNGEQDTGDTSVSDISDTPTDSARDADTAASDADDADGNGDIGDASDDGCPVYETECNGECIPTSTDPDNCGGCGITCESTEVCSGGRCVDSCLTGLTACDRRCVDTDSDSDYCGNCTTSCDPGQGCVGGSCVDAIDVGDPPAKCDGGGPPIDIGDEVSDSDRCAPGLAEQTFRWALCSCEDISVNNPLLADAYDSTRGPYTPGGYGGGVGTNGSFTANNPFEITGTLWSSSSTGEINSNDGGDVFQRLHGGGEVTVNSEVTVDQDAFVVGAISGPLDVGGELHVTSSGDVGGSVTYGSIVEENVSVPDPCTACAPEDRIPVGAIVTAHSGTNNDNAEIGLSADALDGLNQPTRLDLPCGTYYLSAIESTNPTTIVAHGNTALFIEGDVDPNEELTITLTPDAQLDVFVAGNVTANNPVTLGSPNYPARMRFYVGGPEGMSYNNEVVAATNMYAVPGGIDSNNPLEVFGATYVQSLDSNNEVSFHYDRAVGTIGDVCPDPDPDPDPDAGDGDTSDADAGDPSDPVCGGEGDGCTANGDCCTPLVCSGDVCTLLQCTGIGEACQTDAECCGNATCDVSGSGVCLGG